MFQVYLASPIHDRGCCLRMLVNPKNRSREVGRRIRLEEHQLVLSEVIQYAASFRRNHELMHGQKLEKPRREIDIGEGVFLIWNNADVTRKNGRRNVFQTDPT